MIPAAITQGVSNLNASIAALGPYLSAQTAVRRALYQQAATLASSVDSALAGATGSLDSFSGLPTPQETAAGLLGIETSAQDQTSLSDLRGVIGRMVINIQIAG